MELEIKAGQLVWVKQDGSIAKRKVSVLNMLEFNKFLIPSGPGDGVCKSIYIIDGDPFKVQFILVKAFGNRWGGNYLLFKNYDPLKIYREDMDFVQKLLVDPPEQIESLHALIEHYHKSKRDKVDIGTLAKIKGLTVWPARNFSGFWCREFGEFNDIPDGWDLLPKGDSALTKKVRQGPHWVLMRKKANYNEVIGTYAPSITIKNCYEELGGDSGFTKRSQGKIIGQRIREDRVTRLLTEAIMRKFPHIPAEDLNEILSRSRTEGVGRAQWLYFAKTEQIEDWYDSAASLAVRAHVRHQYTDYDERLANQQDRQEARAMVADDIDAVLAKWS